MTLTCPLALTIKCNGPKLECFKIFQTNTCSASDSNTILLWSIVKLLIVHHHDHLLNSSSSSFPLLCETGVSNHSNSRLYWSVHDPWVTKSSYLFQMPWLEPYKCSCWMPLSSLLMCQTHEVSFVPRFVVQCLWCCFIFLWQYCYLVGLYFISVSPNA